MATGGHAVRSRWSRLQSRPPAMLALMLTCLVLLLLIDEATGPQIRIGGLMVAVPALSAVFLSPAYVLVVVAVTLPFVAIAAAFNQVLDTTNFPVSLSTVALISATAVVAAAVRQRRERELAQARWVAEITQRILLRPLPRRMGPLAISSMYVAADEESTIGGDVYATAALRDGARVLVGDVQGKGLAAVEVAGYLLGAFRRSARHDLALRDLPGYLDRNLRDDLTDVPQDGSGGFQGDTTADRRPPESFVTAIVVDVDADDTRIHLANCGHPPPLIIHRDKVSQLDPEAPALPIGLGDLDGDTQHIDSYDFGVGDILLLYTDGVIEARDASGTFYPLVDRLAGQTFHDPDELLEAIRSDLLRHVAKRLGDDVAMVALQRTA